MSTVTNIYRASTIKRDRRTKGQIEQLDSQIIEALEADHPQSVRHVFYLMTNPRLEESVEKSERGYRHVQDRTVKLRRRGLVPYSWITDATRRGYFVNTFRNAADFVAKMKGLYRANLWQHSEYYCEVWCESRSIASVILADCQELAVSLYPSGGFTSIPLAFEAASEIAVECNGRPVVVLYIGDYDPAGVLIDVKIEEELRRHLPTSNVDLDLPSNMLNGVDLEFRRIGITEEQIDEYDLPTKPRKQTDRRMLHIQETVEAEAMPAHILRELLRSEIESLLPPHALDIAKIAEESEKAELDLFAKFLEGGDA